MKSKYFAIILLCLLFLPLVSANYLGTLEFNIQEDGFVFIDGKTNYEPFNIKQTDELINKNKEYWLLDLNTPVFSEFYYSILLPKNKVINHIQSTNKIRITYLKNRLNIIATGTNEKIQVKIQYSKNNLLNLQDWNWLYVLLITGVIGVGIIIIYKKIKLRKNSSPLKKNLYSELNDRQKEIINILKKEKKYIDYFVFYHIYYINLQNIYKKI